MKSLILVSGAVLSALVMTACMTGDQVTMDTQSDELTNSGAAEAKSLTATDPAFVLSEQTSESVVPPNGATTQATHSFTATCRPTLGWVTNTSNGAIVFAFSDGGCRRFNGTFGGPTSWSGTCFGDVSNCNGTIVCQNHCP